MLLNQRARARDRAREEVWEETKGNGHVNSKYKMVLKGFPIGCREVGLEMETGVVIPKQFLWATRSTMPGTWREYTHKLELA